MTANEARDMVLRMVANFPGLHDGEQEVNGGDLVEWMSNEIFAHRNDSDIRDRAQKGSPSDEEEKVSESRRMAYIEAAREIHGGEGEVEIDDDAQVSGSEGGEYVQAWVWVDAEAVAL